MQFNFIFRVQTRKKKKKENKKDRSVKSQMPLPSAVPGAAPPSTAGKHGCSLCPNIYEHKKVFLCHFKHSDSALSRNRDFGCQAVKPSNHGSSAGTGLRLGRGWNRGSAGFWGDVMQGSILKSPFPASLLVHLSFPFNHFTLMGSKTAQTFTSSTTLIKALLFICTSPCDFFKNSLA